jgi:SAM-dependent methyltransferase
MSGPRTFRIDRLALARAFDRASSGYDAAATLQRAVREELFERLQYFRLEPRCSVDLGTGTGEAAVMLRRRYAASQVIAIDQAPGMLREPDGEAAGALPASRGRPPSAAGVGPCRPAVLQSDAAVATNRRQFSEMRRAATRCC